MAMLLVGGEGGYLAPVLVGCGGEASVEGGGKNKYG